MKNNSLFLIVAGSLVLSACSTTVDSNKLDYKTQTQVLSPLEIPPNIGKLPENTQYTITKNGSALLPGNAPSAVAPAALTVPLANQVESTTIAPNQIGNVSLAQNGNQRWLITTQSPSAVWDKLETFWRAQGFTLLTDDPKIGVMETNWAENQAQIQTGFSSAALSKMLSSLYSTPYRDKFITNVVQDNNGKTAIYVVHRGMYQIYTSERSDKTIWQPEKPKPEVENQMLRLVMVALGASPEQAKAEVAANKNAAASTAASTTSPVVLVDGQNSLQLAQPLDIAWRTIGAAIDRAGFSLIDRNRSEGMYLIRYSLGDQIKDNSSLWSRLFRKTKTESPAPYQIILTTQGKETLVQVKNEEGAFVQGELSIQILKALSENILQ